MQFGIDCTSLQLCSLWKFYSCSFIPIITRNHVIKHLWISIFQKYLVWLQLVTRLKFMWTDRCHNQCIDQLSNAISTEISNDKSEGAGAFLATDSQLILCEVSAKYQWTKNDVNWHTSQLINQLTFSRVLSGSCPTCKELLTNICIGHYEPALNQHSGWDYLQLVNMILQQSDHESCIEKVYHWNTY